MELTHHWQLPLFVGVAAVQKLRNTVFGNNAAFTDGKN